MNTDATVGELLHTADREVRSILWDIGSLDCGAMAAAWPDFIAATTAALNAIPDPPLPATFVTDRLRTHQLAASKLSLPERTPDPRLEHATASIWRAATLLAAHATAGAAVGTDRFADAQAARLRLVQTAFIAAHAVATALREHRAGRPGAPRWQVRLRRQVDAVEQVTGSYVQRNSAAFAGERTMPPQADTLADTLAQWDITSHRRLASTDLSVRDLVGMARTNAGILLSTRVITAAAAAGGTIDRVDFTTRTAPALEGAVSAWTELAREWERSRMTTPTQQAGLDTLGAASRVHQCLREVAMDGPGWASPSLIATRTNLHRAVQALTHTASGIAELARGYRGLPQLLAAERGLVLPAKHLVDLENLALQNRYYDRPSLPTLPVAAGDVVHNRLVPPTRRILVQLTAFGQRAAIASDQASTALGGTHPHPSAQVVPLPATTPAPGPSPAPHHLTP